GVERKNGGGERAVAASASGFCTLWARFCACSSSTGFGSTGTCPTRWRSSDCAMVRPLPSVGFRARRPACGSYSGENVRDAPDGAAGARVRELPRASALGRDPDAPLPDRHRPAHRRQLRGLALLRAPAPPAFGPPCVLLSVHGQRLVPRP